MTARGYYTDPFQMEFVAEVVRQYALADGRHAVILAKTYFYPTGGGQDHDVGMLGPAQVLDVYPEDDGTVIHVVDRPLDETSIVGRIDRARRFAFMQHHSAQHLLTQAVSHTLGLDTLSAHVSIDSPSTIDVSLAAISEADLERAETYANEVIYQDRPIKSYFVPPDQLTSVPLRKPPAVEGPVRVIEIESFDYSACGGTHVTRTGMIGLLKILQAEKRGDRTRLYFVAGDRALKLFQEHYTLVRAVVRQLNAPPEGIVDALARQSDQIRAMRKELEEWNEEKLRREARTLAEHAEAVGDRRRLVLAAFRRRPVNELRALAMQLQIEPSVVSFLATYDGAKVTLIVTCGVETGANAGTLVRAQLAAIGARGGGDARLAQGGGPATEAQWSELFAHTRDLVSS